MAGSACYVCGVDASMSSSCCLRPVCGICATLVYDIDWSCTGLIKCRKGCEEPEMEPAGWVYYTDPKSGRIWCMREGSVGSATWTDRFEF